MIYQPSIPLFLFLDSITPSTITPLDYQDKGVLKIARRNVFIYVFEPTFLGGSFLHQLTFDRPKKETIKRTRTRKAKATVATDQDADEGDPGAVDDANGPTGAASPGGATATTTASNGQNE